MINEHGLRLKNLRETLGRLGVDGFIVPRADEHLGEYVPACAERLAYLTGFTGSAGTAIVLADKAAIWSDGRYTLQLAQQTDGALWERHDSTADKPEDWLTANAAGKRIGYDPWLTSAEGLKRFQGVEMVALGANPVDAIWADRPAPPRAPATPHDVAFAGEEAGAKRMRLAADLRAKGEDAAILSDPASLAWAFNIRGADVEFCPMALGYALLFADGTAELFLAAEKVSNALIAHLGPEVRVLPPEALAGSIAALKGKTLRYDPGGTPVWFKNQAEAAGAKISLGADPVALPRALKNAVEQAGSRAAHLRDGAAMVRFLAWFAAAAATGAETEISAAARLLAEREKEQHFRGESFPAISGAGPNGAIIHYRVSPASNRPINRNEVYLIDSGGQYLDGTTDITRTLWTGPDAPPPALTERFTRVLAGHIALAQLIFPEGVAGPHIDAFARASLWQAGLDYAHGTGHGVGSYLSVHEGPASISRAAKPVPLQSGMILSNEPGFYLPGAYGIRLENLVLVQPAASAGFKNFLRFETLSLAPFDRALIAPVLLSPAALGWLNDYHAHVRNTLAPLLPTDTAAWLTQAAAPL